MSAQSRIFIFFFSILKNKSISYTLVSHIHGSPSQHHYPVQRCIAGYENLSGVSTSVRKREQGMRDRGKCQRTPKKLLVQRSPHKQTSKHSAGYSLAARMNVRPHQYDGERTFLWSTNSRRIAFACSPNIHRISEWRRMLFAYTSTLCILRVFAFISHLRTDVDTALHIQPAAE